MLGALYLASFAGPQSLECQRGEEFPVEGQPCDLFRDFEDFGPLTDPVRGARVLRKGGVGYAVLLRPFDYLL